MILYYDVKVENKKKMIFLYKDEYDFGVSEKMDTKNFYKMTFVPINVNLHENFKEWIIKNFPSTDIFLPRDGDDVGFVDSQVAEISAIMWAGGEMRYAETG
ncbi:MAG: hypothetical protein WC284_08450 [Candidimonas sp.]